MGRCSSTRPVKSRNEDLFIAAVEFLSVKYKIDNYVLITKNGHHIDADSESDLAMKTELVKIFQK